MNNERATPNYEFMTDSQEIKFPFNNKSLLPLTLRVNN